MEVTVMQDKDIEFSIVSGSNEEMLFGCLDSLTKTMRATNYVWSVSVTCNNPGGGLPGRVRARYPAVAILDNGVMRSLAANHNRTLRLSRAKYLWILSDDVLVLPDTVRSVTEYMDRHENGRVAAVAPRCLNPDGSVQPAPEDFPTVNAMILKSFGNEKEDRAKLETNRDNSGSLPIDVDTVDGACIALRVKAARQIGPISEDAPSGWELAEWNHRFREQAWRVIYFPRASVINYGGRTSPHSAQSLRAQNLAGALHYFRRSKGPATYAALCTTLFAIFGIRAAYRLTTEGRVESRATGQYALVALNSLRGK